MSCGLVFKVLVRPAIAILLLGLGFVLSSAHLLICLALVPPLFLAAAHYDYDDYDENDSSHYSHYDANQGALGKPPIAAASSLIVVVVIRRSDRAVVVVGAVLDWIVRAVHSLGAVGSGVRIGLRVGVGRVGVQGVRAQLVGYGLGVVVSQVHHFLARYAALCLGGDGSV